MNRSKSRSRLPLLGVLVLPLIMACPFVRDTAGPIAADIAVSCAPDRQYIIQGLGSILSGERPFDVLDRLKNEKGAELVLCAVQRFLDRVTASPSPETEGQRATARAYLDRHPPVTDGQ